MKVLLVDDEIFTIRMLQTLIPWEQLGMTVIGYAQSGEEAYEKTVREHPDIIISDIKMPGMSGLEFLRKVHHYDETIKMILMSAYADFSYIKEGMKLGCSDYILKPMDENELEQVLGKVAAEIKGEQKRMEAVKKAPVNWIGCRYTGICAQDGEAENLNRTACGNDWESGSIFFL